MSVATAGGTPVATFTSGRRTRCAERLPLRRDGLRRRGRRRHHLGHRRAQSTASARGVGGGRGRTACGRTSACRTCCPWDWRRQPWSAAGPARRRSGPGASATGSTEEALVFGGAHLTATDLAVAGGTLRHRRLSSRVSDLDRGSSRPACAGSRYRVAELIDRVKTSAEALPVVVVGGGSVLVRDTCRRRVRASFRPDHFAVANAIGAAIASGRRRRPTCVFSLAELPREERRWRRRAARRSTRRWPPAPTRPASRSWTSRRCRSPTCPATPSASASRPSATSAWEVPDAARA